VLPHPRSGTLEPRDLVPRVTDSLLEQAGFELLVPPPHRLFDETGRRSIGMVVNGIRFVGDQRFDSRLLHQPVMRQAGW
jgi:hypothetical protein